MGLFADRFSAQIEARGKSLTLNGSTAFKALLHVLEPATISRYLTSSEASQIAKPGLELRVKASLSVAVNDTFVLDSRTYTVKKLAKLHLADELIGQLVIAW